MTERRQREQAAGQETQRRIEQLPAEEREAFKRNLRVWREFSPEERDVVRREADERMRVEMEKALQESGLHLDKDQREVFALRYRQERRRMERELQEKIQVERARRLPTIVEGLKREFADKVGRVYAVGFRTHTEGDAISIRADGIAGEIADRASAVCCRASGIEIPGRDGSPSGPKFLRQSAVRAVRFLEKLGPLGEPSLPGARTICRVTPPAASAWGKQTIRMPPPTARTIFCGPHGPRPSC